MIDNRLDPGGVLAPFAKPVLDFPTAAANAMAPIVLDRLFDVTGEPTYRDRAEKCLAAFAGGQRFFGGMAAAYAGAIYRHLAATGAEGQ